MQLPIDLSSVPNQVPQIDPGQYYFNILSVTLEPPKGNQLERYNVTLVVSEGKFKDRRVFDNFPVVDLADVNSRSAVRLRHLCMSAGLGGALQTVDTDQLVNKGVQATVSRNTYTDKNSGEVKEATNVKDYVYAADVARPK